MPDQKRFTSYIRVSTDEQADSGAGLEAQRKEIEREAARRDIHLVSIVEDAGFSAKDLRRPGVQRVLEQLACGEAEGLMVAKLDRLSRSLLDFASLMELSRKQGWQLVALDLGVDTSTPAGEMMAGVLALYAQFERRIIGLRTKEALAVRRAQGVRLGRPVSLDATVRARITLAREAGETLSAIARALNDDAVPTAQGGRMWYPSTVRAVAAVLS